MGVTNSLPKTTQEMPQNEDIKRIWKKQIRKEEKAGHESEYDLSEEEEEDEITKIDDENSPNMSQNNISVIYQRKSRYPTVIINDQNSSIQNEQSSLINLHSDSNDSDSLSNNDNYFDTSDSLDDEEIFHLNTESRQQNSNIRPLYDEFGTRLLVNRVIENISDNKNLVIMDKTDHTIHSFIDSMMSFENKGKFVLIAPQNKIGKLLEKHNDQRITIITSNSSFESSEEKLIVIASENMDNFQFNDFDLIIFDDEKMKFSKHFNFKSIKTSTNYIIFTKLNNHDFLKQIVKNYPQPCHLLFEKDEEQELINETIEIDFSNCIGLKFKSLDQLHNALVYNAAKLGFKIVSRDGLSGKKSPIRFVCDRNTRKRDKNSKSTKKTIVVGF